MVCPGLLSSVPELLHVHVCPLYTLSIIIILRGPNGNLGHNKEGLLQLQSDRITCTDGYAWGEMFAQGVIVSVCTHQSLFTL